MEYGGYDAERTHMDADPWVNLETIHEFLQDGEKLPPDLAQWLGHAIRYSQHDPDELLRRLGLKKSKGRPLKYPANYWLEWGELLYKLEGGGCSPEKALSDAMAEFSLKNAEEISRSQLQQWRDEYRKARHPDQR